MPRQAGSRVKEASLQVLGEKKQESGKPVCSAWSADQRDPSAEATTKALPSGALSRLQRSLR